MEKIEKILYIVFVGIGIISYVITTILAIKRKKAKGEPVDVTAVFDDIAGRALTIVKEEEVNFAGLPGRGKLKLKDALNDIKELCHAAGIDFDKTYWTSFLGKAVDLININRTDRPIDNSTDVNDAQ